MQIETIFLAGKIPAGSHPLQSTAAEFVCKELNKGFCTWAFLPLSKILIINTTAGPCNTKAVQGTHDGGKGSKITQKTRDLVFKF